MVPNKTLENGNENSSNSSICDIGNSTSRKDSISALPADIVKAVLPKVLLLFVLLLPSLLSCSSCCCCHCCFRCFLLLLPGIYKYFCRSSGYSYEYDVWPILVLFLLILSRFSSFFCHCQIIGAFSATVFADQANKTQEGFVKHNVQVSLEQTKDTYGNV